ncbi:hypothetical protein CARUB_v10019488mg [Capsella rubella]|uniref:Thioglucosidase n=1 Tax=Capsella rubella TaxID=81985 RepID=R0FU83_9BRAS|nr:hypothetical protein CARUB_v10019488mg [Capsella rubella]
MTQRKHIYSKQNSLGRSDFPEGFLFGTASSAYQYEGAIIEAPRGQSVWDTFVRKYPEQNKAGQILGVRGGSEWDFLYPQGLRKFLNYAKNKYESPKFMITENGHCDIDYEKKPKLSNLMDLQRTEYHKKHLQSIQQAIKEDGVEVEGYFAWSLLDNCEWNAGYGVRYGLFYVDYNNGLKRFPKMSAMWFKEFLKREEEEEVEVEDSEEEEYVLKSATSKKRFLLATGPASYFIPKMSESSKSLELFF